MRVPPALLLLLVLALPADAALPRVVLFFQPADAPALKARLYAAHEAVAPGGRTELVVELLPEKSWHIYDPIILDTGAPTLLTFDAPRGVTIGPPQFPAPTLGEDHGLEYLAHEGRVRVLAPLEVAADAAVGDAPLRVRVRALMCKEACVPVQAEATLALRIAPEQGAPTHTDIFKAARAALPRPLEQAEYLAGSRALVSHTQVPVGGRAEVLIALKVKAGHHIQDRKPLVEGFIPTRVFIGGPEGIKLDPAAQVWPRAKVRDVPGVGRVNELAGDVLIRAPLVVADEKFTPGPVELPVLVQYQVCDDAGRCFPPLMAAARVPLEVVPAGQPAVASDDPVARAAAAQAAESAAAGADSAGTAPAPLSLPTVFLFAFLGGVILNIMPCVLPVISLKIFGFVQQAGDDPGRILRMGLVYAAGILASFAVIALLMVTAGVAWGGLMQKPGFLIGLTAVVFAFALSLLGVYEFQVPGFALSAAGHAASKEGYGGAFVNGILATLLATPCVGPFLGSAVGVLATLPPLVAGAGIMVVGLGLAAPYVLLTAFPGWLRFVPRPGPWMVTFKQLVGFILVLVVVWLLTILVELVDVGVLKGTLTLLALVAIGCWLVGRVTLTTPARRAMALWGLAVFIVAAGGWGGYRLFAEGVKRIPWQPWEPGIAQRLAAEGYTVYVDYTATWCLTCQTNKAVVLETDRVAGRFKELGVYPITADFTREDPAIQKELQAHGRNGVPLNIVVPAGKPDAAIVLPEVLTPQIVLDALARAGSSRRQPDFWTQPAADSPLPVRAGIR